MKAKVVLTFLNWKGPDENSPLELTGEEEGLHTGVPIQATAELTKFQVYDFLRREAEDNTMPVFTMKIVD